MPKVSYYKSFTEQNGKTKELFDILNMMKNGDFEEEISLCRQAIKDDDKAQYKLLKNSLPCFSVSGLFNKKRRVEEISEYTGLVILDFDNVRKGMDWLMADGEIRGNEHTYAYFTSPSGYGFKIIVKVSSKLENHEQAFQQVAKYYEEFCFTVDQSGKDTTRLCFVSHDEHIFLNSESKVFEVDINKPLDTVAQLADYDLKLNPAQEEQNSESTELELAEDIVKYCEDTGNSITSVHETWYKVAFAMASLITTVKMRIDLFMRLCKLDGGAHDEKKSFYQIKHAIKRNDGKIGIGTLIHYAQEVGYELKSSIRFENQFWYEVLKSEGDQKFYELKINPSDFLEWLETRGFFMTHQREILKQNGFFIEESSIKEIKSTLLNYVEELPEKVSKNCTKKQLKTCLLNNSSRLMTNGFLEYIKEANVIEHKDTADSVYFYFENGIIEVTRDSINLHTYDSLNEAVYRSDINEFVITPNQLDGSSEFLTFLNNVSPNGNLIRSIGYLLSRYKKPDEGVCTVLIDEGVNEETPEASGGRGKSLVIQAVSKLRDVVGIDGKNVSFNRFLFQSASSRTNLIHFDDAQANFEFEKLYAALTGDLVVEKKGQKPATISFKNSPKFAITTNYIVKGTGGYSEERRKLIVSFSNYYGKHLNPKQEFDFIFFDEYTNEQWNDFYNTMFFCVQEYLREGLPDSESNEAAEKEILQNTSTLFVSYMNNLKIIEDEEYCVNDIFEDFKEEYPELCKMNSRTFFRWVRKYLDFNGFKTTKQVETEGKDFFNKRQGVSYFTIVKK